jgi:acylphosphatase
MPGQKREASVTMSENAGRERRLVHFRGKVQGVGFRYTTRQVAAGFDVTGYVQNLADGRVRVLVEGDPGELDRFLGELRALMAQYIREVQADISPATGEFDDFDIRH